MIYYITTHSKSFLQALEIKKLFNKTHYPYFFVYGKNSTNKIEPYIEVDIEDAYESLPLKTYHLIKHFMTTPYDRMIKMDDDTYINFNTLPDLIEDYIGIFVKYKNDTKSKIYHWYKIKNEKYKIIKTAPCVQYAEGSFYSLSKKAAKIITDTNIEYFINTPETYIGEDIRIGLQLQDSSVSKRDITEYFVPYYETTKNIATIHPVHYSLFDKITACKSPSDIINILNSHKLFNHNFKREIYLENIIKNENTINIGM